MAEVDKPTKPGFYWYKGVDGWEPVRVSGPYPKSLTHQGLWVDDLTGASWPLANGVGQWGPEIVRPE